MEMQEKNSQYSLRKIIMLWGIVALPMAIIRFILMPVLIPIFDINPGVIYWCLMIVGMMWQFVLSMIILKKELGKFTWTKVKERLWLNHPIDPKTKKRIRKVYLYTIPIIIYTALIEQFGFFSFIEEWIGKSVPAFEAPTWSYIQNLVPAEFVGAWYLMAIAVVSCIFNYFLGEELFFRGILLPKMNGAFGKFDWVMNGILFSSYHIHKVAEIPLFIIGSFFIAYLSKKYRSIWPAIIIHGVEGLPVLIIIFLVVKGLY